MTIKFLFMETNFKISIIRNVFDIWFGSDITYYQMILFIGPICLIVESD